MRSSSCCQRGTKAIASRQRSPRGIEFERHGSVLTDLKTLRDELILAAGCRLMAFVGSVKCADHGHVRGGASPAARLVHSSEWRLPAWLMCAIEAEPCFLSSGGLLQRRLTFHAGQVVQIRDFEPRPVLSIHADECVLIARRLADQVAVRDRGDVECPWGRFRLADGDRVECHLSSVFGARAKRSSPSARGRTRGYTLIARSP
jgi:hypothetical protein